MLEGKEIVLFLVKKLSLYGLINTKFCGLLVTFCYGAECLKICVLVVSAHAVRTAVLY